MIDLHNEICKLSEANEQIEEQLKALGKEDSLHNRLWLWTASILSVLHEMGNERKSLEDEPLVVEIYADGSGSLGSGRDSLIFNSVDQLAEVVTCRMEGEIG